MVGIINWPPRLKLLKKKKISSYIFEPDFNWLLEIKIYVECKESCIAKYFGSYYSNFYNMSLKKSYFHLVNIATIPRCITGEKIGIWDKIL